jgi:hypothetical protein
MEVIVTLAYFFLVRMVFFDYKLLRFNMFWKFAVFGIYAGVNHCGPRSFSRQTGRVVQI